MNIEEKAKEYKEIEGLKGGYVIFNGSEVIGWRLELGEPTAYTAGVIALGEQADKWVAKGGNDYDGAKKWASSNAQS